MDEKIILDLYAAVKDDKEYWYHRALKAETERDEARRVARRYFRLWRSANKAVKQLLLKGMIDTD